MQQTKEAENNHKTVSTQIVELGQATVLTLGGPGNYIEPFLRQSTFPR